MVLISLQMFGGARATITIVNDAASGGVGNFETILAGSNGDTINASAETATGITITGGAGVDSITGGAGADVIDGGAGVDVIDAGAGADTVTYDSADVNVNGGDGADILDAGTTTTAVNITLADDDADTGIRGFETVTLSTTADITNTVNGSAQGADVNLTLTGNAGIDILTGGAGDDSLSGGAGNDIIEGGLGNNALTGGTGADTFTFNITTASNEITSIEGVANPAGNATQAISDFERGTDKISFDDSTNPREPLADLFANSAANGKLSASITEGGTNDSFINVVLTVQDDGGATNVITITYSTAVTLGTLNTDINNAGGTQLTTTNTTGEAIALTELVQLQVALGTAANIEIV